MNENIDLTQILKDCPKGTKFYSSIHGELLYSCMYVSSSASKITFINPNTTSMIDSTTPIIVGYYSDGRYYPNQGECTIFPSKEQRDWSKFTAPWYNGGVNTEKKLDKNDVHYYVARDKGGIIWLFMGKPIRRTEFFSCPYGKLITNADADEFSNYGLNVRDFDNLKWEDDPVEVFINLED